MRNKGWMVVLLALTAMNCARVSVQVASEDENVNITVPFALVQAALHFTDEGELQIADLGGISEEIDLKALAVALTNGGDRASVQVRQGDMRLEARKVGKSFRIDMRDPEEESTLTMNLPLQFMQHLAEVEEGNAKVATHRLLRDIKRQKGVLMELNTPDERIAIVVK